MDLDGNGCGVLGGRVVLFTRLHYLSCINRAARLLLFYGACFLHSLPAKACLLLRASQVTLSSRVREFTL